MWSLPDSWLWSFDFANWTGLSIHSFMEVMFIVITCLVLAATTIMQYRSAAPAISANPVTSITPVAPVAPPSVGGKRRRMKMRKR